ncbi:MAG: hypothetical protein K8R06_09075 [Methanosarcinales archaeon]|nr:hypothetical protein [Methanosarcinales archaeon]MCD4816531.1 hypothetical protein [Methanosarcinales archaeon]
MNIARALIASANLLLPDETTSALNPESTAVVVRMLREVKRKTTMIGISVVRQVAEWVVVMNNNRMVGTKTPGDILGSGIRD